MLPMSFSNHTSLNLTNKVLMSMRFSKTGKMIGINTLLSLNLTTQRLIRLKRYTSHNTKSLFIRTSMSPETSMRLNLSWPCKTS